MWFWFSRSSFCLYRENPVALYLSHLSLPRISFKLCTPSSYAFCSLLSWTPFIPSHEKSNKKPNTAIFFFGFMVYFHPLSCSLNRNQSDPVQFLTALKCLCWSIVELILYQLEDFAHYCAISILSVVFLQSNDRVRSPERKLEELT